MVLGLISFSDFFRKGRTNVFCIPIAMGIDAEVWVFYLPLRKSGLLIHSETTAKAPEPPLEMIRQLLTLKLDFLRKDEVSFL